MKKAKLIKKTEIAEQKSTTPLPPTPRQTRADLTQQRLTQWLKAQQNLRPQNARAAFAALFTAEA
jgi:hypothetical protein